MWMAFINIIQKEDKDSKQEKSLVKYFLVSPIYAIPQAHSH